MDFGNEGRAVVYLQQRQRGCGKAASIQFVIAAYFAARVYAHHKQNWPRPVQGLEEVLTMYSNRTEKLLLVAAGCAAGLLGCLTLLLIIAAFA